MTNEELVNMIEDIDYLVERGWFDVINDMIYDLTDPHDDYEDIDPAFFVAWLRGTFMVRHKVVHWIAARDNTARILKERDLDPELVLRGLYEDNDRHSLWWWWNTAPKETYTLNAEQWEAFNEAINAPANPNEALRKLMQEKE